jgi:hypothetical protein
MPRTHIVQLNVSIPRQHLDALNAQARKLDHKNAAAWARALLADASGLPLDVRHGGKRAGAGRKVEGSNE